MRQLTVLESEAAARKLVAYLVTERIAAQVDADKTGHIVWVRDEDQLARAKEIFAHFQASPDDPKYHGVEKSAESIRRDEERQRREKLANVVEMRGRWGSGAGIKNRCPAVIAFILISVLVAIATNMGQSRDSSLVKSLKFADQQSAKVQVDPDNPENVLVIWERGDIWSGLWSWQFWRVITPIFLHFSISHLVFNLWCLFVEGGQIEDRRGSLYFLLLVLALAIPSNIAQAVVSGPNYGGMSGVIFGLFGYLWMKVNFDNSAGYVLSKQTIFISVAFFAICIIKDYPPFDSLLGGLLPPIANTAHLVGLGMGLAIGYSPVLLRKK
jgi:GlpG protein